MKRLSFRGISTVLALLCLVGLFALRTEAAEDLTYRDLARRYFAEGNGEALSEVAGLPEPVKHVVALDYTILLRKDDEKPVDPKTHRFNLGDQIRVKIQPMTSAHVYIFHEGASGERICLLPTKQEKPPLIKKDAAIVLPGDGYFEFVAPPGEEQLVVVATERPIADLALLSNVVFKKPGDKLTAQEQAIKSTFKATVNKTLQSIRKRHDERMTFRGLPSKKGRQAFAQKVAQAKATEIAVEEPPHGKVGGTFAMVASTDKAPNLLVTIPLQSVPKTAKP
jgi:hypothetical protein